MINKKCLIQKLNQAFFIKGTSSPLPVFQFKGVTVEV